MTSTKHEKLV